MRAMRALRVLSARLRALFAQRRANCESDDELQQHLQLLTDRFVSQGMSRKDAADAARRQFGNAALLQQRQREARTFLSPPRCGAIYGLAHACCASIPARLPGL
jgi:hypothetical protein